MNSGFIRAIHIQGWADNLEARGQLPLLIRRLCYATTNPTKLDFPANESIQRSGFDGEVECVQGNAWVPDGRSVLELGTSRKVTSKADEDFKKRTDNTPDQDQKNITFIFVTPRHWEQKKEWIEKKCDTANWKEVRAYDADDLEQWLDVTPPVAGWFGHVIGVRP